VSLAAEIARIDELHLGERVSTSGLPRELEPGGHQAQRAARPPGGVLRPRAPLHRRRQPRAAHAAGGAALDPGGGGLAATPRGRVPPRLRRRPAGDRRASRP
jgi:hypothetical protein